MGASKAVATAVFGRVSQFLRWPILSPWHNKGHNGTVGRYQRRFGDTGAVDSRTVAVFDLTNHFSGT